MGAKGITFPRAWSLNQGPRAKASEKGCAALSFLKTAEIRLVDDSQPRLRLHIQKHKEPQLMCLAPITNLLVVLNLLASAIPLVIPCQLCAFSTIPIFLEAEFNLVGRGKESLWFLCRRI